jgi:hypothetical protein
VVIFYLSASTGFELAFSSDQIFGVLIFIFFFETFFFEFLETKSGQSQLNVSSAKLISNREIRIIK